MDMADHDFPVDRTAILNFAAAIGETNPIYWDRAYAARTPLGDVIAPPTFGISAAQWNPDYGLRGTRRIPVRKAVEPKAEEAPRGGGGGGGGGGPNLTRVLHAEQRFEYKKPLQPGMQLTVASRPGNSWEKEGKRGGKLFFTEGITEYRDANGELVLVATSVTVVTGKAVDQ
jgi:N-terminal half of MaoC dehydratase